MKLKLSILVVVCICSISHGQWSSYDYERQLNSISQDWHSVSIPAELYSKVQPSLNDIRIYGITEKDTIEAPYFLKVNSSKSTSKTHNFKIINQSKTDEGYWYTFLLEQETSINDIKLKLEDENFDWKVNLEGSNNQTEWFSILENYRILSIKNASTDYRFRQLKFPTSSYKYFRLLVKSKTPPSLTTAQITTQQTVQGDIVTYDVKNFDSKENKTQQATILDVELHHAVPVHRLRINVGTNYDYFRSVKISYLADSVQTEKEWKHNYRTIKNGTLSSLDDNDFSFSDVIARKFRVTISNYDNQPLNISSITMQGYSRELVARFTEPATYHLLYGNNQARRPNYDILKVKNNIPDNPKPIILGPENQVAKPESTGVSALFENEYWLWVIMAIIILLLGGFTFKMLNNSEAKIIE